jgi:hypothetical protein
MPMLIPSDGDTESRRATPHGELLPSSSGRPLYGTAVNFFSQSWAYSIIIGKSFSSGSHPNFTS